MDKRRDLASHATLRFPAIKLLPPSLGSHFRLALFYLSFSPHHHLIPPGCPVHERKLAAMLETDEVDDMQEMWDSLMISAPAASHDDKNGPREPPPPATPLEFPNYVLSKPSVPEVGVSNDLITLFSSGLRIGLTSKHLQALNVNLTNELPLEQVVPAGYIPHLSWSKESTPSKPSESSQAPPARSKTLSNGKSAPGREEFLIRVNELLYDIEDASRAIQRKPPLPNRQPARISYFRKFWEGLLSMADFWDTSLDNYSDGKDTEDKSAMDIDEIRSETTETEPQEDLKRFYTGRRTGTGREMPGRYREHTVFALVEILTWAFHCRLEQPHSQQKVYLQGSMISLPHAASVHRVPKDVNQATRAHAEGPMLGVSCREQTSFRSSDEVEGEGKQEVLDLLRETGLMLLLAQKRAREGKEEPVPGEGKWWAHAPRWGGGAGGELGVANENTTGVPSSSRSLHKRSRNLSRMNSSKSLQPPSRIWERGMTYQQIGKVKDSEYDDVSKPNGKAQTRPGTRMCPVCMRFSNQLSRSIWSRPSTITFPSSTSASTRNTSTILKNPQLDPGK